jgi:short-subunit dehydrogenase
MAFPGNRTADMPWFFEASPGVTTIARKRDSELPLPQQRQNVVRVARPDIKRILITGASSGLGEALTRVLARQRHQLGLVARRDDRLQSLESELSATAAEIEVIPADLANEDSAALAVCAMIERFGAIDVLINNAGIGLPEFYGRADPDQLREQIAVNLTAPILLTRHALASLLETRGVVINIGSGTTTVANPVFGVYGATKAGLRYWNDALRREYSAQRLRVCYVDLGPVDTTFFEAVERRANGKVPLGTRAPHDGLYNAVRDRPPAVMTAGVEVAAQRIARLVTRPRRRLTLLRRVIWPLRIVGLAFQLSPVLGDLAVSGMIRRVDREQGWE